ncbi:hypothetical protein KKA53_04625 [Candidatus Dependentiae bacterium]|nr:hypothetical protein [Candidatus Dependentiae bacterium]
MKIVKIGTFLIVAVLSWGTVSAKTYQITTNNDEITGTIRTCSSREMRKIIGCDHSYAQITDDGAVDYLKLANKSYMLVKITIENNSDQPIYLPIDSYLSNTKKLLVTKDAFLFLYPNAFSKKITSTIISAILAGLTIFHLVASDEITPQNNSEKALIRWLFPAMAGPLGIFVAYQAIQAHKLDVKRSALEKSAYCYKKTKNKENKKHYATEVIDDYKVPAGHVFQDTFFVNLKQFDRTVFDEITPELVLITKP